MPETESNYTPDKNLDDKLADFADQTLVDRSGEINMSSQDLEFQELEKMIMLLNRASSASRLPPQEMQTRIQSRLEKTWNEDRASLNLSPWQQIAIWLETHQRQLVYSGTTLVVVLLLLTSINALSGDSLLGSAAPPLANDPGYSLPFALILVVAILSAAIMWLLTRTKN